jgi:uncharacterized protein
MNRWIPEPGLLAPVMGLAPVAIYHFGSSAGDPAALRDDSDIDLAFFSTRPCDPYAVFLAAQEIARLAGCEVDLVDLRRSGSVFKAQVIGQGRRIFTAPGGQRLADEFEMLAFADYARLNEERGEIIAAELAR